jgi:hypothetical protein
MSLDNDSNVLYFIGEDVKIDVDYDIISKWSDVIREIKWDKGQVKEFNLLTVPGYSKEIVIEHLQNILSKLHIDSVESLREPTQAFGMMKIPGNISNLYIYLLLSVQLGLNPYIDELTFILNRYQLNINTELELYVDIYERILRHQYFEYLQNIFNILTFPFFEKEEKERKYPLTPIFKTVLQRIIVETRLKEYERYMLAYNYDLPLPEIGIITGRRLYNEGIVTPVIGDEIPLIEGTKDVIVDSLRRGSRAVRIGVESDRNKGLFWLYCDRMVSRNKGKYSNHNILTVGSVTIDNKKYNLKIKKAIPFSLHDLETGYSIGGGTNKHKYIQAASYLRCIRPIFYEVSKNMNVRNYLNSLEMRMLTKMDNQFRQWLGHRDMLTESEEILLQESLSIQNEYEQRDKVNPFSKGIVFPETPDVFTDDYYHKLNQMFTPEDISLHRRTVEFFKKKKEYYSTEEVIKFEESRQSLRDNFFFNGEVYGGIVIVLKAFVISLEGSNIIIDPTCYGYEPSSSLRPWFYHTHVIPSPKLSFIDIVNTLPKYKIDVYNIDLVNRINQSKQVRHINFDLISYRDSIYEPNSLVVFISINENNVTEPLNIIKHKSIYPLHDPIIEIMERKAETFRLVDESTIPNLDEVKNENDINFGTHKMLTLAYPSDNPKIYVQAGIETQPPRPYLWYKWDLSTDKSERRIITELFRLTA